MPLIKLFSREYSVQYTEVSIRSLSIEAKRHLPSLVFSQAYLPEDKNESCYADSQEWQKFLRGLSKKYQSPKNLKQFFKKFQQYGKSYVATAKKISNYNLSQASNTELAGYYQSYQKVLIDYSAYLWVGYLLSFGDNYETAKKLLENKGITNPKIIAALFHPKKLSSILGLQEKLSRYKAKQNSLSEKQVRSILKNYLWMPCLDIHNNPWTSKDVINFFANLKPPVKQISFSTATKLAKLNKKQTALFKLMGELVYIRDMRDEYRRRGICNILPLFEIIAQRLGLSRQELAYFSSEEIVNALIYSKKLSKSAAFTRQKGFLIYTGKTKIEITSDAVKIHKFKEENLQANIAATDNIQGACASKGHARGRVKIVLGIKDLSKVKRGDIMVAITTHPDFVPAMHRAAAIITDEGGLTSHAAIVAREMGVACVVGTKLATKILKDGDLVEVDATKGIVRLIKKSG